MLSGIRAATLASDVDVAVLDSPDTAAGHG